MTMLIDFLKSMVGRIHSSERGQDLSEYGLILGLIALVVIGAVMLLGNNFSLLLGAIAGEVGP